MLIKFINSERVLLFGADSEVCSLFKVFKNEYSCRLELLFKLWYAVWKDFPLDQPSAISFIAFLLTRIEFGARTSACIARPERKAPSISRGIESSEKKVK